ncbi:MAG: L-seryl-tRNA(Sec) selenium transferase [Caldilineaceae bacterium]
MSETATDYNRQYRKLPAVDALLRDPAIAEMAAEYGRDNLAAVVRTLLDEARAAIAVGVPAPEAAVWAGRIGAALKQAARPSLLPVINATGVIIHTNLGRAPLSAKARAAIVATSQGYSNLEYKLDAGVRGSRHDHARARLCRLTGAEDALIVNNNAGAVFLTLAGLCRDTEVIVSRGQLVEIGGGFRIPDVLRQSGATLVEVGTTNRTHLRDFEAALSVRTGAIMRIHSSNFRQIGFVTEPLLDALAGAAHGYISESGRHVLMIDDLGSGTLLDTAEFGLSPEPMVQSSLDAGADIVTFSGDKLLGGPQAGIVLGRAEPIARLRRHPLARALRVDKMTLSALDATLLSYEQGRALEEIPVWRMISASQDEMHRRAQAWRDRLSNTSEAHVVFSVISGESAVGGGSLPGETLPTHLLAVRSANVDGIAAALRNASTPVVCRIQQDHLLFDPRTVLPEQEEALLSTLTFVLRENGAPPAA